MLQIGNARTIYLNLFSVPLSPSGGHICRVFLVTYSIENNFVCLLSVLRVLRVIRETRPYSMTKCAMGTCTHFAL